VVRQVNLRNTRVNVHILKVWRATNVSVKAIRHRCVRHCLNATYRQYLERLGTLRKIFAPFQFQSTLGQIMLVYHDVQTTDFSLIECKIRFSSTGIWRRCQLSIHRNVLSPSSGQSKNRKHYIILGQPWRRKQKALQKYRQLFTKRHGSVPHKTLIFIFTAMKAGIPEQNEYV